MSSRWMPLSRRASETRGDSGTTSARARRKRLQARLEFLEDRTLLSSSIPLNSATWTAVGPAGVGGTGGFGGGNGGPAAGRVDGVTGDPNNANVLFVAAAGGGVWKSVDAGKSWSPLTDNQATLFMGSIAVAKSNSNVIYAGTGQAENSGDQFYGRGLLKSTDGGTTWAMMGNAQFDRKAIVKIAISGSDPNTVFLAVSTPDIGGRQGGNGIWKTTDGGTNWTNTTAGITTNEDFTDVVIDPTNPLNVYMAVGSGGGSASNAVYKTTDGGNTWAVAGDFPAGATNGRINLAISRTNPKEVVASVADPATDSLKYLLKTTDSGTTWSNQTAVLNYMNSQASYNNTVAIDPNDPNVIFASGVINYGTGTNLVVESRDGGTTWFDITRDSLGGEPHTDSHASGFDANGKFLLGGDGGVWRLDVPTSGNFRWSDINSNLQTIQYVGNSLDPTNADIIYGGAQDNGTSKFSDNLRWNQFFGGDGGFTGVDPSNPQTVYLSNFGVSIARSDDGGKTVNYITTGIGNDPVNFYAPFAIDPSSPSHLLYGTDHLYSSNNKGNSWTSIAGPGGNGWTASAPINRITIAPSDSKTIYLDTDDGKLLVSTDGGVNWNDRSISGVGFGLQQITVDPTNPQTAYTVFDDFGGKGHVFKTTDGGANWANISGNLPDIPTLTVAVDVRPGSNRIYVGTDTGVFATSDGGVTWAPYKTGLPNVQVTTLELNTNLNILMAGTYGRGVFEIRAIDSVSVLPVALTAVEGTALPANTLVARFNDSTGNLPVGQYTATIDWGDATASTTGTVTDLGNGFYGVLSGHTYSRFGTYKTTVTVTSTAGSSGQASSNVAVQDAPLSPSPVAFSGVEGTKFSGVVGTFSDANPLALLSDLSATIDWGNGNVTRGTITPLGGGNFSVSGSNLYNQPNSYGVRTTVTDLGGKSTSINSTADVADAALTITPQTIRSVAGTTVTATVASFTDLGPADPIFDYYANIDWGDGTKSSTNDPAPTVSVFNRGLRFDVVATHTYTKFGTYNVTVTAGSVLGSTVTTAPPSQAIIADAPLSATPANFTVVQGTNYTGLVAGFTSTNTFAQPGDFSGTTIDWGDQSPATPATITANGGGVFGVSGSHVYNKVGTYPVSVQVVSGGGSTAPASGFATVVYAPLTATGTTIGGTAGQSLTATVATFTDQFAGAALSGFTSQIDWGDGTTSAGVVAEPGGPGTPFVVTGTHAFAKPQTFDVSVSVLEDGNLRDTASTVATIADATLTASGATLTPVFEGGSFGGTVGTFTTGNVLATPSDFVTTVDWGDGTTSNGLAAAVGNGVFSVSPASPHVFGGQGDYLVTLNVISLGGKRASAVSPITVKPAPINPAPGNQIASVAGQTFTGTVGTFTQFANTPPGAFAATIDWGNGDVSPGVVSAGPNGTFVVGGTEIFRGAGQFGVNVTVTNGAGGPPGTFSVPAKITDAVTSGTGQAISAVAGRPFTAQVDTLTTPNVYAKASEYTAAIDWGDGTSSQGSVVGGGGDFSVTGTHAYANRSTGFPVTVTVLHTQADGKPGASSTVTTTARVLAPASGGIWAGSDSGVSNTDGFTNVTRPVFLGRGEPGATVQVFAAPTSNLSAPTKVGTAVVDATGSWAVQVNPLGDGSYVTSASMLDTSTGIEVSRIALMNTALTVVTAGPTVASTSLDAPNGLLRVSLQPGLGGFNPAGLVNPANYSLALPVGAGLQSFAPTGLRLSPGSNGQLVVTLSYNLGGRRFTPGGYVVTIHAAGITDLAGNILTEHNLVTFPQAGNFPNPDYVAQIDVSKTGVASAPHNYVSIAEQIAAGTFSATVQGKKVVRVPRTQITNLGRGATPKPTTFKAKARGR